MFTLFVKWIEPGGAIPGDSETVSGAFPLRPAQLLPAQRESAHVGKLPIPARISFHAANQILGVQASVDSAEDPGPSPDLVGFCGPVMLTLGAGLINGARHFPWR